MEGVNTSYPSSEFPDSQAEKVTYLIPAQMQEKEKCMPDKGFGGPYIQAAGICQTSIIDNMGLLSVVRFLDRIPVIGMTPEMRPQPLANYQLVVALKSGEMRGKANLRVTPTTNTGRTLPPIEAAVLFEGEERGYVLAVPLNIVVEEEGLHWLELTLDGALLSRIPFRVMYQRLPTGMQIPPSGGD